MEIGSLEQDHLHNATLLHYMKDLLRLTVTTISTVIFNMVLNTIVCTSASGVISLTYLLCIKNRIVFDDVTIRAFDVNDKIIKYNNNR